jgi:ABC-type nitrate/sulfonate/bicarbonate transport system permease component
MEICWDSQCDSVAPQHHVWWYPTGPLTFIPIHAARLGKGKIDVSHLVISSYLTTLNSFFQSREKVAQDIRGQDKFLAVSQPDTLGQVSLPLSMVEVETVMRMASSVSWPNDYFNPAEQSRCDSRHRF